jgi:AraC-like DNA-binding protein
VEHLKPPDGLSKGLFRQEVHLMDILSDVLRAVRLTGAIFFHNHLQAPFAGGSPDTVLIADKVMPGADHVIQFHALLSGYCWAALTENPIEATRLEAGDIIIFPMGNGHVLSSAPGMHAEPNLDMYDRPADRRLPLVIDNRRAGGQSCHFVCGYFGCDARPFNPLLESLPRVFRAQMSADSQSWLSNLLHVAAEESGLGGAGSETMLAKLAELIFVEVIRKHIARLPEGSRGWLSALRDRHIGHAMQLIHGEPSRQWTLESLAHEVSLSRSVFADRFTHHVGLSPIQYLTRWRMQLASRLLEVRDASIVQVAAKVGYESEAAFNRSFRKYVGVTPGIWRKTRLLSVRHQQKEVLTSSI